MSTKRKTLKQKKVSEQRRSRAASDTQPSADAPIYTFRTPSSSKPTPETAVFSYNLSEIRTSLLTFTILILANGLIFILTQNNIIPLQILGL